jgi:hypothetical protein
MTFELSTEEALLLRTQSQLLTRDRLDNTSVQEVVRHMVALQAQERRAAQLGVRARSQGLTAADVDKARETDRTVVRTWCMRGTLHLVPAEDVGWLTALLGHVIIRDRRRRYGELGLDESTSKKAVRVIQTALAASGPLTRAELGAELVRSGLKVDVSGQALPHLIGRAALEGLLCHGPMRENEETYVLLADWVGRTKPPGREESLAELALRYIRAYGPATPDDFAAWSGLPLREARTGWKLLVSEVMEIRVGGMPTWVSMQSGQGAPPTPDTLRLLPAFDAYLMGYRSRDLFLEPAYAARVQSGGIIHPTIIRDGQVVATWRYDRSRKDPVLRVEPFQPFPVELRPQLEEEAGDIGRFLGEHPTLEMPA